jgi:cytoskeletal protein CcmA (bactofilin family)
MGKRLTRGYLQSILAYGGAGLFPPLVSSLHAVDILLVHLMAPSTPSVVHRLHRKTAGIDTQKATDSESATQQDSHLAKGTEIIGTLFFEGPVFIDGHVEGEITGHDKITVGENGFITADKISAASIVIAGAVKVNTIVSGRIEILPTGKVWGDLTSSVLSMHEGARFEGKALVREAREHLVNQNHRRDSSAHE